MAARIHHQHLHALHERSYVTQVSIVYVTPTSAPTASPNDGSGSGSGSGNGNGNGNNGDGSGQGGGSPQLTGTPILLPPVQQQPTNAANSQVQSPASSQASHGPLHQSPPHPSAQPTTLSSVVSSPAGNGASTNSLDNQNAAATGAVPSGTASATPAKHGGLSTGASAGIAVLVIVFIALIAGVSYGMWRKKRNAAAAHQRLEDEKSNRPDGQNQLVSHVSVRRNPNNLAAPRLSLRPVTDMFPTMQERQASPGPMGAGPMGGAAPMGAATLAPAAAGAMRTRTPEPSPMHPEPVNPFMDDAVDPSGAKPAPPLGDSDPLKSWPARPTNAPVGAAAAPPSDMGGRESPAPGMGPGPRGPPPNNVHRVQLDFKPTMDDELALTAGQLVRMLHEYDDGWALCIRLDRSQQGVIPRNCISKLPVKPRAPGNGPPPPQQRGPPQGRPMGPSSPHMDGNYGYPPQRPSPPNAPYGQPQRPASPGPFGQGQYTADNSADQGAMGSAQTSPVQGNAVPARKPVPGQAM